MYTYADGEVVHRRRQSPSPASAAAIRPQRRRALDIPDQADGVPPTRSVNGTRKLTHLRPFRHRVSFHVPPTRSTEKGRSPSGCSKRRFWSSPTIRSSPRMRQTSPAPPGSTEPAAHHLADTTGLAVRPRLALPPTARPDAAIGPSKLAPRCSTIVAIQKRCRELIPTGSSWRALTEQDDPCGPRPSARSPWARKITDGR